MNKPLISIITTCKNSEKTIESCIKSILNQTYPYIEYIIQDGGSADKTLAILNKYKGLVKVYSKGDRVADEGLISCYSKCTGYWIGTCLSDEVLKVDDVDKVVNIINSNTTYLNSGAVYSNCEVINFSKNKVKRNVWWASKTYGLDSFLKRRLKIPLLGTFFNNRVLTSCGIKHFRWGFDCAENELFLRVSLISDILYIGSSVGSYFVEGSNLSIQPNAVYIQMRGLFRLLEKNLNYKCQVPFYFKKINTYRSKQLMYLAYKFTETKSIKEAFDCYFTSTKYQFNLKDLVKFNFHLIKNSTFKVNPLLLGKLIKKVRGLF